MLYWTSGVRRTLVYELQVAVVAPPRAPFRDVRDELCGLVAAGKGRVKKRWQSRG